MSGTDHLGIMSIFRFVQTRRWVEDIVGSWDFRRIIPAHFAAPVQATPQDFRCCF